MIAGRLVITSIHRFRRGDPAVLVHAVDEQTGLRLEVKIPRPMRAAVEHLQDGDGLDLALSDPDDA
jgi:hypothetical protein